MATKSGGKMTFGRSHQLTADILSGGQKFWSNRCISHCFPDKFVFTFYAEIQDGRQKLQESDFWENSPVDSGDTLALKNFNEIALSFLFSAKIQDGHHKLWKLKFFSFQ